MNKKLDQAIRATGKIIDYWLPMKIQYDKTPGAVVCIAVNGVPKYQKSFGVSDIDKQKKLNKDAQFRVASMSKMFTAVAVMQLQEKGKLRLDDKVADYLPWFKGSSRKSNLSNVTIRQLLSHNSGLCRDGVTQHWVLDEFPESIEETITNDSIVFENATTMKYSNHGYAVLGALIEKIGGVSYERSVTENIIKPLGLRNTLPDLSDKIPKKLVPGYERWKPDVSVRNQEPHIKTHAYAAATGFISDAKDLAIFLAALHPDSKENILSRESKKTMQQVQSILNETEMYGLGLRLFKFSNGYTYGHGGGFAGYVTHAMSYPIDNVQVIVLTNTISTTAGVVAEEVMRLLNEAKGSKNINSKVADSYSGIYRNRWRDFVVAHQGDGLYTFPAATPSPSKSWIKYREEKHNVFRSTERTGFGAPGETLTFKKMKNGKATLLASDSGNATRLH